MTELLRNWLPADVSTHGATIDEVVVVSVTILSVLALFGLATLVVFIVRGLRRLEPLGEGRRPWLVPLACAGLFLVGFDGYLLLRAQSGVQNAPLADALRVEVNAHQWAWGFRYAGRDGQFATPDDVVTTNELRIAAGRSVLLELGSSDVVHAFHLPNFRIKREVIPGRLTRVSFRPQKTGRFDIACAQFCGALHYRMQGTVYVVSDGELARWLDQASEDSLRIAREEERARAEGEIRKQEWFPALQPAHPQRNWGWPWR